MIAEQIQLATNNDLPQFFAKNFNMRDFHVSEADEQVLLSGPRRSDYQTVWDRVLTDAHIDIDGETWKLAQQDDCLFAIKE